MRQAPKDMTEARDRFQRTLACPQRRQRAQARLGLGSGDRFEVFQGGSRCFEERVLKAEKPARLQGKRSTKRVSRITWLEAEASMVRRGSPVRVRKRALQRPRKTGSFVFGPAYTPPARSGVESVLENRVLRRIPSRRLMIVSGGTRARGSRRLRTSSRGRAAAPGSLLSG